MSDTTVKKVGAAHSPKGPMGQTYLASGVSVSMRLWEAEPSGRFDTPRRRQYETVGFVIAPPAQVHGRDETET